MSSFESGTLRSVRQLAGTQLITMEYSEDYKLDEFMKIGVNSDAEMLAFVVTHLLGGTAMDYALPDMGVPRSRLRLRMASAYLGAALMKNRVRQ